jgi:hypothetical protein
LLIFKRYFSLKSDAIPLKLSHNYQENNSSNLSNVIVYPLLNKIIKNMKSFERWTFEDVEETFGAKRIKNHPVLYKMAGTPFEGDDNVQNRLEVL